LKKINGPIDCGSDAETAESYCRLNPQSALWASITPEIGLSRQALCPLLLCLSLAFVSYICLICFGTTQTGVSRGSILLPNTPPVGKAEARGRDVEVFRETSVRLSFLKHRTKKMELHTESISKQAFALKLYISFLIAKVYIKKPTKKTGGNRIAVEPLWFWS
jgi:hypothetical protein